MTSHNTSPSPLSGSHVLVTGGAGFIGSHLCERLLAVGCRVTAIDDLSTGSLENLASCRGNAGFQFVRNTVRNETCMYPLIQQADIVVHLAAAVGVQLIVDRPVHTIETNIHGSEVVLSIANTFNRKVLIASTSEVYGKSERIPFREDDDTVLGSTRFSRWSYACSKAIDEFLGLAYHHQYGLPVIIARFFNTVGPRQTGQYGMVLPRFVERALRNETLQVYGDGKQTRCFCHVSDVVEAVMGLLANDQACGSVFNIGSNTEISIEGLAQKVISLAGSKSDIEYIPYEQAYGGAFDDMRRRVPSLERIGALIGYTPRFSLEEIITAVIEDKASRR